MGKLCGYCRGFGHRSNKCEVKNEQITAVRKHVYLEKVALHKLLLKNGLGVGAILGGDRHSPHVIRSLKEIFLDYNNSFVDFSNVKYKKSVRSYLKSYTGIRHHDMSPATSETGWLRYTDMSYLYLICSPLDNLAHSTYEVFSLSDLKYPPSHGATSGYYAGSSINVLDPSEETDINETDDFYKKFALHIRLGETPEGRTLFVDPIVS